MSELITDDEVIRNLRMALDSAETRIRELEERNEELAEAIGEQVAIEELNARIAKAKAILAESVKRECGTFETRYYYDEIKSALQALEGK